MVPDKEIWVVLENSGRMMSSGLPLVVIVIPPPEESCPEIEDRSIGIEILVVQSVGAVSVEERIGTLRYCHTRSPGCTFREWEIRRPVAGTSER